MIECNPSKCELFKTWEKEQLFSKHALKYASSLCNKHRSSVLAWENVMQSAYFCKESKKQEAIVFVWCSYSVNFLRIGFVWNEVGRVRICHQWVKYGVNNAHIILSAESIFTRELMWANHVLHVEIMISKKKRIQPFFQTECPLNVGSNSQCQ